jgi:hypothetical protein
MNTDFAVAVEVEAIIHLLLRFVRSLTLTLRSTLTTKFLMLVLQPGKSTTQRDGNALLSGRHCRLLALFSAEFRLVAWRKAAMRLNTRFRRTTQSTRGVKW